MSYIDLHTKLRELKDDINPIKSELEKGISIVIPVYSGMKYIDKCLESIYLQEITDAKCEVIIVLNGVYKKEFEYLLTKSTYTSQLDLLILINDEKGASSARNLGMRSAKYSHVTFLDIDDYISSNYIQASYNLMTPDSVVFTQIHDEQDNIINSETPLNKEIMKNHNKKKPTIKDLNKISTITVCKVIPKNIMLLQDFRTHLRSGEDTVFFVELFVNSRPNLKIVPLEENAIYYRRIIEDSVSRKDSSFDFLIYQRIEILEILDSIIDKVDNNSLKAFIMSKYNAQMSFMNKYITENINDREKILDIIKSMSLNNFNYSLLNRGLANTLVMSYCFPPYSDTSATIVAKRLLENDEIVDVVSNNMTRIRKKEPSLKEMIAPLIGQNLNVNVSASFSNMYYLKEYIDKAFIFFAKETVRYRKIYSRAMFPISHIPGLFMKVLKPDLFWVAEFSDPLLYNIESDKRYASIENYELVQLLENGLLGRFSKYVDDNLFNLSEIIPFALADQLVFTNENQLEYMVSRFDDFEKEYIREKSVILKHPTLEKKYYYLDNVNVDIEESLINIAYFGNFYSKRGYDDFLALINYLNMNYNYIFKLHVYTNIESLNSVDVEYLEEKGVKIYPYLSFTEFLNVTTKYDFLLMNDAKTEEDKFINPYLPSKLSDYLGSETPIIAFTENNSVLSELEYENLYKIKMTNLKEDESVDNHIGEVLSDAFIESLYRKKNTRYLNINQDGTLLSDKNYEMKLTKDLVINNIDKKEWLVLPVGSTVNHTNSYEVEILNNSNDLMKIGVRSYYSLKNVIKVEFIYNNDLENKSTVDISRLRTSMKYREIPQNETLKIKLKYNKSYKKQSFVNAGRLIIKGV